MISTEFHLNDGEKKLQRDVKGMFYLLNRAEHFGDEKPNDLFFLVFYFHPSGNSCYFFLISMLAVFSCKNVQ